jgi:hypothetical protein
MMPLAHSPCPNLACADCWSSANDVRARHNVEFGHQPINQSLPFDRARALRARTIALSHLADPPHGSCPTHLDAARAALKSP